MKPERYDEALSEISDKHILESVKRPASLRKYWWVAAVAAVLVVAIGIGIFRAPMVILAEALAIADESRIPARPMSVDYDDIALWRADYDAWLQQNADRASTANAALLHLQGFLADGSTQFLASTSENLLWSPVNAYIGLAMTAEVAAGNTRQQILDLLGTANLSDLRKQTSAIWEVCHSSNKNEFCTLANSLWLENGLSCTQETLDVLSRDYYASVYRGDLGSDTINGAIGAWLNNNTGGMLRGYTNHIHLPQDTLMALYATISFQAKWQAPFKASNNTQDPFHGPSGDKTVTFMNKSLAQMNYYWSDCFSAVALTLKNGSTMWFILPDEGMSTTDVLSDGQYLSLLLSSQWENKKYMKVNLSVPKFDVSCQQDLREGLQSMGLTDLFADGTADFSAITGDSSLYVKQIQQAVRVQIDEEGVKAAAYIEIPGATSAEPPEEIIDFILNRPFIFAITRNNVPLFAGVVNEP